MAGIDYAGIRAALKSILEGDARTNTARIFVEEEPQFGLQDAQSVIVVYTDRRTSVADPMARGRITVFNLRTVLWVLSFSLESYSAACHYRDHLLSQVELVLMENRSIQNKVTSSWLEGGSFVSAREASSGVFVAAAELVLVSEVRAVAG